MIEARTAEGFALYALFPEQYLIAAERWIDERVPSSLTCIGIRSIGAPLAHVVAAAAKRKGVAARVATVRPRGHPYDRHIAVTERFRESLLHRPSEVFAIVDEGPGLSGSSFAAVAEALRTWGIPEERIVLFPSWRANPDALKSSRGREALRRHRLVVAAFEDVWPARGRTELSAGAWRREVFRTHHTSWPAAHPQHERRKFLSADRRHIERFAGLGRRSRTKFVRAQRLSAINFVPAPAGIARGFLTEAWVNGTRLTATDAQSLETVDRLAAYLACLRREFETGRTARVDDLVAMIAQNAPEASPSAPRFQEPEVAVDGRMLPHEWVRTSGGALVKADALDHHDDDFLPCCRDIAWDVAGTIVEFELSANRAVELTRRYRALSGDATIDQRLPFYVTAYLAYRIGYTSLAQESLGDSDEGRRFRALHTRYRRSLEAHAALHPRAR